MQAWRRGALAWRSGAVARRAGVSCSIGRIWRVAAYGRLCQTREAGCSPGQQATLAPPCSHHPQVFVPETPKPTRSLWGDDLPSATASTASAEKAATDFSDKLASTIGYGGAGAAAAGSGAVGRAAAALVPEWWVPPNTAVYVPAGRRKELQQQVRAGWRLGGGRRCSVHVYGASDGGLWHARLRDWWDVRSKCKPCLGCADPCRIGTPANCPPHSASKPSLRPSALPATAAGTTHHAYCCNPLWTCPCPCQAKAALRELEDAKLAGMDYPLSTLRTLRMLCQVSTQPSLLRRRLPFICGAV